MSVSGATPGAARRCAGTAPTIRQHGLGRPRRDERSFSAEGANLQKAGEIEDWRVPVGQGVSGHGIGVVGRSAGARSGFVPIFIPRSPSGPGKLS